MSRIKPKIEVGQLKKRTTWINKDGEVTNQSGFQNKKEELADKQKMRTNRMKPGHKQRKI